MARMYWVGSDSSKWVLHTAAGGGLVCAFGGRMVGVGQGRREPAGLGDAWMLV